MRCIQRMQALRVCLWSAGGRLGLLFPHRMTHQVGDGQNPCLLLSKAFDSSPGHQVTFRCRKQRQSGLTQFFSGLITLLAKGLLDRSQSSHSEWLTSLDSLRAEKVVGQRQTDIEAAKL